VIHDLAGDRDPRSDLLRSFGLRTYVCHPLIARGRLVGTLSFGARKPVRLSEDALAVIRAVSDQVAMAIDRKRAEDERKHLLESERAARSDAERANRLKDEFLATLSHELRSPLNAILGWTHLLRNDPSDPAKVARAIDVIERNARTQAQLISDLLDMSRITSGKLRLDLQQVDLPLVIESALETVRPLAAARGLRIVSVLEPLDDPVAGDPARLEQVVWNLLSNAVKFTPASGAVQVALTRDDQCARIVVTDTGRGIEPQFLPHIFERFRQGDASTAREHGGLGLGLALVRQLVELHGGKVSASSPGPGKGATFTVELPLARAAAHPRDPHVSPPRSAVAPAPPFEMPRLRGVKVLVVDDEEDARELVKRVLEESEAEVFTAGSTDEALDVVARVEPDVLVSDIGMPGRDGYDLIATIRRSGRPVAAAALTAFARSEDRTRALFAGFNAHIAKPVDATELLATVASLAGRTSPATSY
jgi:signal transduction histidine kinase/CheY-like chemotaxis protein